MNKPKVEERFIKRILLKVEETLDRGFPFSITTTLSLGASVLALIAP